MPTPTYTEQTAKQTEQIRSLISDLVAGVEAPGSLEDIKGYAEKIVKQIDEYLNPAKKSAAAGKSGGTPEAKSTSPKK